jgi:Flp pilus assembly protein TadG
MRGCASIRSSRAAHSAGSALRRAGVAAVEFGFLAPVIAGLVLGVWEVGRIVELSNILWNGARESARDASLVQDNLSTIASNLLTYLQAADPTDFVSSHSTTIKSPTISLPANTTGYMCWDNTTNQELFTITFTDITNTSVTDPTGMSQLDHYQIGIQVPYSTVGWTSVAQLTGITRLTITVDWACMADSPFTITPSLPAQ